MRNSKIFTFKNALTRSLILHAVIVVLVVGNISFQVMRPKIVAKSPDPIQAVAITENDLKAEVSRLKKIDEDKQTQADVERQRIAEDKARLERERQAEQQKLAQVKQQQLEAQKALERENVKIKVAQQLAEKQKQDKIAKDKAEKLKEDNLAKEKASQLAKKQEDVKRKAAADVAKKQADEAAAKLAAEDEARRLALEQGNMREIEKYKLMVQKQIMRSWLVQGAPKPNDATKLYVRVAPSGTVLDVQITSSSGNPALDRSAVAAVYKASPLPVPEDPVLFSSFRELRLTLRPDAIVSEG